jgi:adenosylcobyric acid synthase
MKAISILGTSSNSGKSWVATALCAWLRRHGIRVAPFKAQNMSNNSFVTWDGGEIGRAQAVQAEAAGLLPTTEMNPILLKPSGALGSQLVVRGKAQGHIKAVEYYQKIEDLWPVVTGCLEEWKTKCDVLVIEGAGSPVELNLMDRDLANLRPITYLDGRWLLVGDIERGGVFAQIVGTTELMPKPLLSKGLGLVVNKFRGDLTLFSEARALLHERVPVPYLGVLPFRADLQPESEDSLCQPAEQLLNGSGEKITWIRFPHLSNSQDVQPWLRDGGISIHWATRPADLDDARIIILPGTKDTIADLRWMRETGLAEAVISASKRGVPIVGICGGLQMLGVELSDPLGQAGEAALVTGLGLLPVRTIFQTKKEVRQVSASWQGDEWLAYEIHMGRSEQLADCAPLLRVLEKGEWRSEGWRAANVWGTYLHGLFESSACRKELAALGGIPSFQAAATDWRRHLRTVYDGMADLLDEHLDLKALWHYVAN